MNAPAAIFRILLIGQPRTEESFGSLKAAISDQVWGANCLFESAPTPVGALAQLRQAAVAKQPFALAFVDFAGTSAADELAVAASLKEVDQALVVVICSAQSAKQWKSCSDAVPDLHGALLVTKPVFPAVLRSLTSVIREYWNSATFDTYRIAYLEQLVLDRTADVRGAFARLEVAEHQLAATQRSAKSPNKPGTVAGIVAQDIFLGLERGEFSVHYQPLVEIATRKVASLEALVRWTHPTRGPIQPNEFIPVAEESGVIVPLGEFVLRTACAQVMQWDAEGLPVVPVAVNLSAIQLQRRRIWKLVRKVLQDTGMHPELLALELTESSLLSDAPDCLRDLHGLRRQGVRIEIDDFGTGYSSLSYLKRLPIDVLKIDRSFIRDIHTTEADEAIVCAILGLARRLGLKVVAEGVETIGQLEILEKNGCQLAQGYYFSRPLPAEATRQLLIELALRPSFTETLRLGLQETSIIKIRT